jgi:GntR family transcriptional regulator
VSSPGNSGATESEEHVAATTQARAPKGGHKHQIVRAYLSDLIANELTIGDAVPSERVLTEKFGVSRMTVRQALDSLVADGVLQREQGRGTFVAPQHTDFEMRLTTFGEEARRLGLVPSTQVIDSGTLPAGRVVAEALGIAPEDRVHYVERLRFADGTPMAVERAWVPVALAPDLLDNGVPDSLYGALRERGHSPTWGEDTIMAAEASAAEQAILAMTSVRAVLRAHRKTYSDDGACMYSQMCYRGDRYSVVVPLREARPTIVPRLAPAPEVEAEPAPGTGTAETA